MRSRAKSVSDPLPPTPTKREIMKSFLHPDFSKFRRLALVKTALISLSVDYGFEEIVVDLVDIIKFCYVRVCERVEYLFSISFIVEDT